MKLSTKYPDVFGVGRAKVFALKADKLHFRANNGHSSPLCRLSLSFSPFSCMESAGFVSNRRSDGAMGTTDRANEGMMWYPLSPTSTRSVEMIPARQSKSCSIKLKSVEGQPYSIINTVVITLRRYHTGLLSST